MKPILFNTDMVRAILKGRKTVTRIVIKDKDIINAWDCESDGTTISFIDQETGDSHPPAFPCQYQPGDILYVRETWARSMVGTYLYKATNTPIILDWWHPSIYMPKEAARLFLRVTDVRVERLRDITEDGARSEGCFHGPLLDGCDDFMVPALYSFQSVWDSTVKKTDRDTYGWAANPWVWVIEFERCEKPEEGTR